MKNIDFLPESYRQRDALRQARVWWCAVVLIFGTAIGLAAGAQLLMRQGIQRQLKELAPQYVVAQKQIRELANLQSQINAAGRSASLFTFLENPWPRTQILAELVRPLPESIRLTEIHIGEEEQAATNAPQAGPQAGPRRRGVARGEDEVAKLSPAEQDLKALRAEAERRLTYVDLAGHTTEVSRLHQYVGELGRSSLFVSAQIKSLEVAAGGQQPSHTNFTLRIVVRPGYGSTSGEPTRPDSKPAELTRNEQGRLPVLHLARGGDRP